MKIERVLITGVAGFIGSNLLDFLLEKTEWKIVGYDNFSTGSKVNIQHQLQHTNFTFVEENILNIKSLKEYQVVFHLAALPRIQPSFEFVNEHIRENLLGSTHLLETMIREDHYPRFVFSSSSAIYGTPHTIPTPETERVDCLSPYAFQKYETEKYLELLSTRYPLDYVNLRYFNPYGPRSFNPANTFNAYSSVVGIFLNQFEHGKVLQITGDGKQQRDFIHVKDLAKANYLSAIHPEKLNTALNIGNSATLSILQLAKHISDNYEFIAKREGEAEVTYADNAKAKTLLGWEPTENVEDYIDEVKRNLNKLKQK